MIEPEWLKAAIDCVSAQGEAAVKVDILLGLAKTIERNSNGFVTYDYNVHTDTLDWVFGSARWQRLIDPTTDRYYADDPFAHHRDEIPLAEFMAYLDDWYWPRRREQTTKVAT